MTGARHGPVHRLHADHSASARALAAKLRRGPVSGAHGIAPTYRQASVVSADGGSPPTCTVQLDAATPGPAVPLVRYAHPIVPVAGDVVYVAMIDGDAWVISRLRGDGCPAYVETTTTITGVTTETMNSATFLTVYLEAGRRYRVEGQFRADSSQANTVIGRVRYAAGANPTTSSTLAAIDEGATNINTSGARTFRPIGYPLVTGSNGSRTFGLSTAVQIGGGTTVMGAGNAVIFLAVSGLL